MCTLDTALPVKMERRTCSAEDYAPPRIGGDGLQIMQLWKIMRGGRIACSAEDYAPPRIGGDGLQTMQLWKIMRGGRIACSAED
jgi:hypothetical protein